MKCNHFKLSFYQHRAYVILKHYINKYTFDIVLLQITHFPLFFDAALNKYLFTLSSKKTRRKEEGGGKDIFVPISRLIPIAARLVHTDIIRIFMMDSFVLMDIA